MRIGIYGGAYAYAKQKQMNIKAGMTDGEIMSASAVQPNDIIEKMRKDILEYVDKKEEPSEADKSRTELIRQKLMLGGELTDKELEHLKAKAPEMYDDYINAENERKLAEKAYSAALKRCRTKEEVERVRQSTANSYLANAKKISENRELSQEQKAIRIAAEMRKASDVNSSTEEFRKTAEYRRLPEDEEDAEHGVTCNRNRNDV